MIPLVEKCEVVVNRYLCVTASRSPSESNRRDKKKRRGFVEVLEKIRSVFRTYVQKPEQKEAIEYLLKGRNILAV